MGTCRQCGSQFSRPAPAGLRQYCSEECRHTHFRAYQAEKGRTYKRAASAGRFPHACAYCGSTIELPPVGAPTGEFNKKYCTADCRRAARADNYLRELTCVGCGLVFNGKGTRKFCSTACRRRDERRRPTRGADSATPPSMS